MTTAIIRIAISVILVWFAIYGLDSRPPAPSPAAPSPDVADKLKPVAAALSTASHVDRCLWAEVWTKAAEVVEGDATDSEVVFSDTRGLRLFTVLTLDLAWHRIAGNKAGKYPGLREATEAFLSDPSILGRDDVALSAETRSKYIAAVKALAWAGVNRG